MILYIVLCGAHPFDPEGESTPIQIMNAIKKLDPDFSGTEWKKVSPGAVQVAIMVVRVRAWARSRARARVA